MNERLIVMTRYPELGRVKSRLAASIGDESALAVHERLVRHTMREVIKWGGDFEVRITGGTPKDWSTWMPRASVVDQGSGDLGRRMARAGQVAFESGVDAAVWIGTDCPGLDAAMIGEAFRQLRQNEVVFGPAEDGGYYLIGTSVFRQDLFEEVPWGSDRVLACSLERAPSACLLPVLGDVDQEDDLVLLDRLKSAENDS